MALPKIEMPKDEVDVQGTKVPVRGLSRAEVLEMHGCDGDLNKAEVVALVHGAGVTQEEAQDWRENTPADLVGLVLDRIVELSGLAPKANS